MSVSSISSSSVKKGTLLNFSYSASSIMQIAEQKIAEAKTVYDKIVTESNHTFDNVVAPMAMLANKQLSDLSVISFLGYVSTEKEIRDASNEATKKEDEFFIDTYTREDLYKSVNAVYQNKAEMDRLCDEDKRLLNRLISNFQDNGLGLDKGARESMKLMNKRLSEISVQFKKDVDDDTGRVLFTREELLGLPETFFEDRETETVDGVEKFVVTTKYPDIIPVLEYAKRETTRYRIWFTNKTRCPKNIKLLQEAVELRRKCAKLLGYKNHAEFKLKDKMAKMPEAVMEFEHNLLEKLQSLADKEMEELETLKKADKEAVGEVYNGFNDWDFSYYNNVIKQNKHNIDMEELKQYFSLNSVLAGILGTYENMLGLRFVRVENTPVWHPDVQMYEVWNAEVNTFAGHFYLDLHPRDNKFSHAAAWPLRKRFVMPDGSFEYPVSALVTNFPKPTSSAPALLTHDDVVTLMHELGHVFHNICAKAKWSRFSGTSVERDFVEAPSQMLENWAWDPSVLQKFAVHYKTGEPISKELTSKLVAAKNVNSGMNNLRQIFFGLYDMQIYSTDEDLDVNKLYNDMLEKISRRKIGDKDTVWPVATFGHIISGYDAGYYGYLWAEVFSADMFETRFAKEGLDNKQTGKDYRNEILLPGGSRDAALSLERFLGRKPQSDAFLKSIGLTN
ncbi:metalloendopeptidase [Coemansia sp. RSA 1722]|nr:metalloendopeptidase [Coemansia sp. RSA 1722]